MRPIKDAAERARWDELMAKHHYLGFRCLYGGSVRQVAGTFVDSSRFEGTCYRASNWTLLGQTRGYTRTG